MKYGFCFAATLIGYNGVAVLAIKVVGVATLAASAAKAFDVLSSAALHSAACRLIQVG